MTEPRRRKLPHMRTDVPRWVYLHVDAAGNALYAGCTNSPKQRLQAHMREAAWAAQIDDVVVYGPFDPEDALHWERELIGELEPLHNIKGTSRDPRSRRARGLSSAVA